MSDAREVCIAIPAKTDFSVERATSIDLYVHDHALASQCRLNTIVVADAHGSPLPNVAFHNLDGKRGLRRLRTIVDVISTRCPSILVVHQNVMYASALAHLVDDIPVVFVQHRLIHAKRGLASHAVRGAYKNMTHIVCASDAARRRLGDAMPELAAQLTAVPSGLSMQDWTPAADRLRQILVVGRCLRQKGILQAARAVHHALQQLDDWSASFILSVPTKHRAYVNDVIDTISAMGPRATLTINAAHAVVKRANEQAAIALVPSLGDENFARTALEAHAGGAALISSGRGALKEVSGDCACYVNPEHAGALTRSIVALATDAERRDQLASEGTRRVRALFDIHRVGRTMDDLLNGLTSERTATVSGNVTLSYFRSKYLT